MDLAHVDAFLDLVMREQDLRRNRLPDDRDAAYDEWLFSDRPFVNDLCVLYLVAIRHEVERRLIDLAVRDHGTSPLTQAEYRLQRDSLVKNRRIWDEIESRVGYRNCARHESMEVLRTSQQLL